MRKRTLLLGSTGGFGGAMLRPLLAAGHEVTTVVRPGRQPRAGVRAVTADPLRAEDLARVAEGHDNIVCGLNFPHGKWTSSWPRAIEALTTVAAHQKSRIVFPANIYGLGPHFDGPLSEQCSRHAPTAHGRLRNDIERQLVECTRQGARLLMVRAGDFFGPGARNTWFYEMTKEAHRGGPLLSPASDGALMHEWAYLPDLANVTARLMDAPASDTEIFHFAGHLVSTDGMLRLVAETLGQPRMRVRRLPWLAVSALAPVMPSMRFLRQTRYLWEQCVRLDDQKLRERLGTLPHTPLPEAVRASLALLAPMRQVA